MVLTELEIRSSLTQAKAAFPHFSNWEYDNEVKDPYSEFSLWGEFVADPDDSLPRSFFVTFDTHQLTWRGHLTIGKHCYLWSDADFGDAHLVDTDPCATLQDAIASLKRRMTDLFTALSGSTAGLGRHPDG